MNTRTPASWPAGARWSGWIFGVLALAAVAAMATHQGDIDRFVALAMNLAPGWLLLALLLQAGTYACVALQWRVALAPLGPRPSFIALGSLALQKLFVDQAVPSGGVSGDVYLMGALHRRRIATGPALGMLLAVLVAHYIAYGANAGAALVALAHGGALRGWMLGVTGAFLGVCIAIPVGLLLGRRLQGTATRWLVRTPRLQGWLKSFANAPVDLLRRPGLMLALVVLDIAICQLDALTLWVMLHAIGANAAYPALFASFMLGLMVAMLGPLPMGLGAFEGACIAALVSQGVRIEDALVATVLLRGWTTWLPMLPGLALVRRQTRGPSAHHRHAALRRG